MVELKPIRSERDYEDAMELLPKLWGSAIGTVEGDQLDILVTLIEAYEREHYPIDEPTDEALAAFDEENASFGGPTQGSLTITLFKDSSSRFRFRIAGQSGQILLTSEGFDRKADAVEAIRLLQASAFESKIIDFAA